MKNVWQLQDAKNKFSSLVNQAIKQGPQVVTKHGEDAVIILSVNDYQKLLKPKDDLIKFFKNSPLTEIDFEIERIKETGRKIEL